MPFVARKSVVGGYAWQSQFFIHPFARRVSLDQTDYSLIC